MDHELEFIGAYLNELREGTAAIFAGAGLSAPAGFVDWRELLRPIAEELNLDIDRENDLVAVAQYHCNENAGNRHRLNQLLIEQLTVWATPTENHSILARLPIHTYWTTNYDTLIETALKSVGKIPDVKYTTEQLTTTKPKRDAVVYKMHGDVEHPNNAVLIKDDYEKYHLKRGAFINALSGDLVSKTFLFVGFSFSDPNIDYVLGRLRVMFRENQRRHYCIFRRHTREGKTDAEFEHAQKKLELRVEDLKRFNLKTLLIDDYAQITEILTRIERQYVQWASSVCGEIEELRFLESAIDLRINLSKYTLTIAGRELKLQPQKFFYYVLFAHMRKQSRGPNRDGFVTLNDIQISDLDAVFRLLTGNGFGVEDYELASGFGFLEKLVAWVKQNYIDPDFQQAFLEVKAKIKDRIGRPLNDRFAIAAHGERGETRYGLNLAPKHIYFE